MGKMLPESIHSINFDFDKKDYRINGELLDRECERLEVRLDSGKVTVIKADGDGSKQRINYPTTPKTSYSYSLDISGETVYQALQQANKEYIQKHKHID